MTQITVFLCIVLLDALIISIRVTNKMIKDDEKIGKIIQFSTISGILLLSNIIIYGVCLIYYTSCM